MGILDEAIREHLELKRQHGAGDSELRDLEDEAFGPPARPGAASEAAVADAPVADDDETGAKTELLAGLQEAPPEPAEAPPELPAEEEPAMEHPVEQPGPDDAGTVAIETEEHPPPEPAEEPEAASEVEPEETSVTDQPTELYDFGEQAPAEEAPAEEAPAQETGEPVEDEFFSEQSLSDELDQALDAPETEGAPVPEPEPVPESSEPPEEGEEMAPHEPDDHFDDEGTEDKGSEGGDSEGEDSEGEDVLEETPEFLQDTPEHDRLWFEQRPPKDFDFDD
jgi:hypothetical protein